MSPTRIEALADAIGLANGIDLPDSKAYQLRNPGLLRSFSLVRHQETDDCGVRIFTSFIGGYRALVHDLTTRCQGLSRATVWNSGKPEKLRSDSQLRDLLRTYGMKIDDPIIKIVKFLRVALRDESIGATSLIKVFVMNDGQLTLLRQQEEVKHEAEANATWLGLSLTTRVLQPADQMKDADWRGLGEK